MTVPLGFEHRFVPGEAADRRHVLLLLHGNGGSETDLLPLGRALLPGAALLSPRGPVEDNGQSRFFNRVVDGRFDTADLRRRAEDLCGFVAGAAAIYGFDAARVVAVGYSNGANMAAAVLLSHPDALAGAVLFRPMVPLQPDPPPALAGRPILLAAGRDDPTVPEAHTLRLHQLLQSAGADVELTRLGVGHGLGASEITAARRWLARRFAAARHATV